MANGINKVILIGNLGADPEVKHLESGNAVANLPIATTEYYRDKDGNRQERTEWHRIVLWRRLAEIAEQYLHKGDQIYIEGRLQTRSYEKDGVTKYITEVVGNNMTMLGKKSSSGEQQSAASPSGTRESSPQEGQAEEAAGDDDLPF
ncbi:MAG: single-stranded DNA-binding protein [Bacteroidales bacterium]|nr:single-stranded DNA-binding protein [Bacteroidales bacterium]MCF8336914.1 single-stranded DNA-binding protein [Bacteroidales bacterium]